MLDAANELHKGGGDDLAIIAVWIDSTRKKNGTAAIISNHAILKR